MKLTSYYADNLIGVANARVIAERIIELNPEVVDGQRVSVSINVPVLENRMETTVKVVLFDWHRRAQEPEAPVTIRVPKSAEQFVQLEGLYDDVRILIKLVNE